MMLMPLHHVSFRGRGPMVGPRPVRYFSVAAPTCADALALVERALEGADGEYAITRAKPTTDRTAPGIVAEAQVAA